MPCVTVMEDIEFSPYDTHKKRLFYLKNGRNTMSKIIKIPVLDRIVQNGQTYYCSHNIHESTGAIPFKSSCEVEMEIEDEPDSTINTYRLGSNPVNPVVTRTKKN